MDRPIFQQHFGKGPRVHYGVSVTERPGGIFDVVYRWENPKSSDSRTLSYPTRQRAMTEVQRKSDELVARGYERRPPVVQKPCAEDAPASRPEVSHVLQALGPKEDPSVGDDSLEGLLAQRRRAASWAIE